MPEEGSRDSSGFSFFALSLLFFIIFSSSCFILLLLY